MITLIFGATLLLTLLGALISIVWFNGAFMLFFIVAALGQVTFLGLFDRLGCAR